jgi:hypothetical protein
MAGAAEKRRSAIESGLQCCPPCPLTPLLSPDGGEGGERRHCVERGAAHARLNRVNSFTPATSRKPTASKNPVADTAKTGAVIGTRSDWRPMARAQKSALGNCQTPNSPAEVRATQWCSKTMWLTPPRTISGGRGDDGNSTHTVSIWFVSIICWLRCRSHASPEAD